jgi:hypothetical protein
MLVCEGVDLLDDIANMDRGSGRSPLHDGRAMFSQVIWRDLGQKSFGPDGLQVTLEDRTAHRASAVSHRSGCEPSLAEFTETLGLH